MGSVAMEWSKHYETGLEELDAQHRYFFSLMHAIRDSTMGAPTAGQPSRLARLLHELEQYALVHFSYESQLMEHYRDPAGPAHRDEHTLLLVQLQKEVAELEGGTIQPERLRLFLFRWFARHTGQVDRDLAAHVLQARAAIGLGS